MSNPRTLIVGAGLGGLTARLALDRAGLEAPLFEQAGSLEEIQVGIGMVLWPNGLRALRSVGLAEEAKALGTVVERVEFFTASGERLNTWDLAGIGDEVGEPTVALSRGELHALLSGAVGGAEAVRLGSRCVGFSE